MIHQSLLDLIGRTPVVRLPAFSAETGFDVYAKLESFNPGGSHKSRIALAMIRDAEAKGILHPGRGQTLIEPSGGNTGIGLAIAANILGYRLVLVIPDNYSPEKQKLLRLYGAEVVLSDSRRGNNSHGELAMELQLLNPEYVMLNQQRNPANPYIHRHTTAQEILQDFAECPPACLVAGIGTGGHITGLGEALKVRWPCLRVLGVEPEECDLLRDRHAAHGIQGLSIGLVPSVLNLKVLDGMIKVGRRDCLDRVRQTMHSDGLSLGLSSAANLVAIDSKRGEWGSGTRVLTLVYDSAEGYLPEFC
ncbi:PLP-dependent cysteine synthase family protein [Pseudomonas sp. PDM33]|uniref:PLP-dependent cysteine synthase family protein n=1 Tax=Pseudomonas sp. PDM33 TaxID=2854765 RepID=UPI001C45532B|nr:PLP-dependent cysteine synthase family protein [Pseudomonas sp. PDM33]MBV7582442.1 PLP-dependent cysteine synthase family protein [Pseudomonas sp. PDM33]